MDASAELEQLLEFLYSCPVALVQTDDRGRVEMMNPAGVRLLHPLAEGHELSDLFGILEGHLPMLRSIVSAGPAGRGTICQGLRVDTGRPAPGAPYTLVLSLSIERISTDRLHIAIQDVSQSAAAEASVREAESKVAEFTSGLHDAALIRVHADGRVRGWNASAVGLFGVRKLEALGADVGELIVPDADRTTRAALADALHRAGRVGEATVEGWFIGASTARFWGEARVKHRLDPQSQTMGFTLLVVDVTRHRERAFALEAQANSDPLTGLANRRRFEAAATKALRSAPAGAVGLAILDVDHFKRVNDLHGHAVGDVVLRSIARVCRETVRESDLCARIGGEEFVVFMPRTDPGGPAQVAERLRAAIEAEVVRHGDVELRVCVSIGVVENRDGEDLDALLARADAALYGAKRAGRNRVHVGAVSGPVLHLVPTCA